MLLAPLLLLSVPAVLAPVSAASRPAQQLTEKAGALPYSVRTWTTREGLPQVSPRAMAQTPDGYLWVGTFGGLARFDGVRFEVYDLSSHRELRSNRITSLLAARDGALWVGTEDAGVVRLEAGVFEPVQVRTGESIGLVLALCEDATGTVWAGTTDGLFRCARNDFTEGGEELTFERDERVGGKVRDLCLEDSGELWIASADGLLRLDEERIEGVLPGPWFHVALAEDGGVWAAGETLVRARNDSHELIAMLPGRASTALHVDSEGVVWVGCRNATVVLRDGEALLVDHDLGPLEAALQQLVSIFEDREGNLWFGGLRTGLSRVRPSPLAIVADSTDPTDAPRVVAVDGEGVVWVESLGLNRVRGEVLEPVDVELPSELEPPAESHFHPTAMTRRAAGGLWLASPGGLSRLEAERVELVVARDQLGPAPSRAVLETSDGSVWVGARDGLDRWRDGVVEHWGVERGAPEGVAQVMLEDSRGALWVGTAVDLARFDGLRFESLRERVELPYGSVRALYEDPAGDLWIGTYGAGLYRLRGEELVVLGVAEGLHEATVSWILPDGSGHLLLLGNQALTRCPLADLTAVADGEQDHLVVEVYDQGPGISAFEGNGGHQSAGVRTADGLAWFCTVEGLARFDPARLRPTRVPPSVQIEWVRSGGVRHALPAGGLPLELASGARDLELGFSAPSLFDSERIRFQYRLLGYDDDWVDAGSRRTASYARLPPGDYDFSVRAANAHGVWSVMDAELAVDVAPRLVESGWVRAIVVALGLSLLAGLVRLRTARSRRIAVSMEREVARRTVELLAVRRQLEHEVAQRTQELSNALDEQRRDLEHRRELETQLHQAEKLEAIGRLAGGLAHDFNNILTVVLGEAEIARQLLGGEAPGRLMRSLDAIHEAGSRAADLTRQLLAYSGRRSVVPEVVDVGDTLAGLSGMLRRLIRGNIELDLRLPDRPLYVETEPGQLEQVVVNLVVNACDAMPHGGQLTIEVVLLRLDTDGQELVAGDGCDFARISVRDDGDGMAEETLGRIFEPFYSTKAPQRGTGLGLASVHGIVAQAGGEVRVSSELGRGTTFDVLLPLADGPTERAEPRAQDEQTPLLLCGTVLLCDDEESVRSVVRTTLERAGLRVLEASSATEALELARASDAAIDLLVTDVIMPGGNGRELATTLREMRPEVRVLYVSGYSAEVLQDEGMLSGDTDYISKPFRADELLGRVAGLLEAEGLEAHQESVVPGETADSDPLA